MAANTVFIINNTVGTPIAAIQPNTLNGPGGVQQSSDLSMFGLAYATWGQPSDQNDYRLLENFACPQSVTNPSPIQPMGESELGAGNGINAPLVGQLWFNTTNQTMYVNTATGWDTVSLQTIVVPSGAVNPSPVPAVGSLFFNTGINQLLISNGSVWESVAANYLPLSGGTMTGAFSMGNHQIHNLLNPTAPTDAATKQYVDTVAGGSGTGIFVPLAGGTMTGPLVMSSTNVVVNNGNVNVGTGNVNITTGTLTLTSPAGGIAMTANGRILNVTTTALTDAVNANYGDTRWLNKTSVSTQTVTAPVVFNGSTQVSTTPTNPTDVANKAYVDSSPGFPIFVTPIPVYQSPSGFILNGTIGTVTYVNTWQTVHLGAGLFAAIPATAKAVILEAFWVPTTRGDGDQTNQSSIYQGFVFISNNSTGRPSNYTAINSQYILARGQTAEYKYYNATSTTNQGVFPVRNSVYNPDGGTIGTFDYLVPSPFGGAGGFYGIGFRITGYYS